MQVLEITGLQIMIYKYLKYLLICTLIGNIPFSYAQSNTLSLEDAIAISNQKNKELQLENSKGQATKFKIQNAKNELYPDLNVLGNASRLDNIHQFENGVFNPSTRYDIPQWQYGVEGELYMPIFEGGKIKNGIKIASIENDIQTYNTKAQQQNLKLSIIAVYLKALNIEEQLNILNRNIHQDSLNIAQSQSMRNNGVITDNEVLRTQVQLNNHLIQHKDLTTQMYLVENELKTTLSISLDSAISIDTRKMAQELYADFEYPTNMMNYGLVHNPKLNALELQQEVSALETKVVTANKMPKIGFQSNYRFNYPNNLFFPRQEFAYRWGSAGITLKMPLDQLFKNKAAVAISKQREIQASLNYEIEQQNLENKIAAALKQIENANYNIELTNATVEQAKENYRLVRLRYANKLSLITELIDADNTYLEMQSKLVQLKINKLYKYYQLQHLLGNI